MIKIGIMTFHWATNHGAILQAYAMQTYLSKEFHADVQIIDYFPKKYEKNILNCIHIFHPEITFHNMKELGKEKKLKIFRKKYLNLSKRYFSQNELINSNLDYDVLISGSDQVWNPHYTSNGENRPTFSYYLNFGKNDCIRIAYSVSFGCEDYPKDIIKKSIKYIKKLDFISVREDSGINILNKEKIYKVKKTADPTLLIPRSEYEKLLLASKCSDSSTGIVYYVLRKQNKKTQ